MSEEKETWAKSKSKAILRRGIINGTIPAGMPAAVVRQMNLEEHEKWPVANWKNNLANLRAAIDRDRGRMAEDARDFGKDKALVMEQRKSDNNVPWHLSECPKLLKADVDVGLHLTMKPKELHMKRHEYQAFQLTVFRKHVYQEIDSRPKRDARFERKKKAWKYPELHEEHPRLKKNT